jgi:hypothetical protein
MADSAYVNLWLALIAVASLVQSALLLGMVIVVWRMSRQAQQAVERFEHQQLAPLMGRVHGAVDDVRQAVGRAREIEGEVRRAVSDTSQRVASRFWPVIATARAMQAAVSTITNTTRR